MRSKESQVCVDDILATDLGQLRRCETHRRGYRQMRKKVEGERVVKLDFFGGAPELKGGRRRVGLLLLAKRWAPEFYN